MKLKLFPIVPVSYIISIQLSNYCYLMYDITIKRYNIILSVNLKWNGLNGILAACTLEMPKAL